MRYQALILGLVSTVFLVGCKNKNPSIRELLDQESNQKEVFAAIISDRELLTKFYSQLGENRLNQGHPQDSLAIHQMHPEADIVELMEDDMALMERVMRGMILKAENDSTVCKLMIESMRDKYHLMGQVLDLMLGEGLFEEKVLFEARARLQQKLDRHELSDGITQ